MQDLYNIFTVYDEMDWELFSILGVSRPELSANIL